VYQKTSKIIYRVSGKKVSLLIEILGGILLKIQLKAIHFFPETSFLNL